MAHSKSQPVNRLHGHLPKIGIRPVIDGRCNGVRESLEAQTMSMAKSAAALISQTLTYPSGQTVEVVISDCTIGGVAEAARCQEQFERAGVGVTLTVTPCWCYGTEVMDQDPHTVKAVWGFNGTERPGAVFLAAVLAAHAQKGLPAFSIYGHNVQDAADTDIPPDVSEKILRFVRAAVVAAAMRGKSYLQVGSMCMGIAGSALDQDFFQHYLGMRSESVDETEIVRRIERGIYDKEEFERALRWTRAHCPEGKDVNAAPLSRAEKDAQWAFTVKCFLILRDLMIGNPALAGLGFPEEANGHNALAAGVQGQRQWTDHLPNFDFPEALLCSQFDWNGIREAFVMATENDTLNGVTMLFLHLLTGAPGIFADVRTYWSPEAVTRVTGHTLTGDAKNGFIHLINSGAAALEGNGAMTGPDGRPTIRPWYDMESADVDAVLAGVDWCPANVGYFRGGGFSSHYKTGTRGGMPVTMARVNLVHGLGPVLQIAEGVSVTLPGDVHDKLEQRTDPTWPTTWFAPRLTGEGAFTDVYSVMANWGANHAAFCCGHVGADLITLAAMLRIPVSMHNVSTLFRPAYWNAFGTTCPESADYMACRALGPLY